MSPESAYHVMATIAFPVAAGWALLQWYGAIHQRKEELRWKRAEAAWKLMDGVFENPHATIACELIDGERNSIDVPGGKAEPVSAEDVPRALDLADEDVSPKARAIRYAFNCLLYALDRLESAIASGYVLEGDVESPTRYYARLLRGLGPRLEQYARDVGYVRALALISRLVP